jgi:hypothetical protein
MISGEWRNHPKLKGRFHESYPDDLQVMIHDGGPRLTGARPELVWVRVTGCSGDVFRGRVLDQPHQLRTVAEGSEILFVIPQRGKHPLLVTDRYLRERPDWVIHPCDKCGLSELFDAPSDLIRVVFPGSDTAEAFTAFCGACGGVQVVMRTGFDPEEDAALKKATRKWWQFWK